MEIKDFIKVELLSGKDVSTSYSVKGVCYDVKFCVPEPDKGINIYHIIAIPKVDNMSFRIAMESNNLETDSLLSMMEQGARVAYKLALLTDNKPCPIVVPLLPSIKNGPYFQQLSSECFELSSDNLNYRIDNQVLRIIEKVREGVKEKNGQDLYEKIFLNGYSCSGVFAQRFALIHPEVIDTICIGGASGSIPIPDVTFDYPIGVKNYKKLFGKDFNVDEYLKIRQRYYVGEFETINKVLHIVDDNGNPVPMHDMSYFNRSVLEDVGRRQRAMLGEEMFERARNTINILEINGVDIVHTVIPGRTHNDNSGHGVNELADKIINDSYTESIKIKNKER